MNSLAFSLLLTLSSTNFLITVLVQWLNKKIKYTVCSLQLYNKPISSSQASIYCWLCKSVTHVKCAGLTLSVSDAIGGCQSDAVGVHYWCSGSQPSKINCDPLCYRLRVGLSHWSLVNGIQRLNQSPKRKKCATREVAASEIAGQLD